MKSVQLHITHHILFGLCHSPYNCSWLCLRCIYMYIL